MMKYPSLIATAIFASVTGTASQAATGTCPVTASYTSPVPIIDYDPFAANLQKSGPFSISITTPTPVPGQPRVRSVDYQFLDTDSQTQARVGNAGAVVELVRAGRSVLLARSVPDFSDPNTYHSINVPNGSNVGTGPVGALVGEARQDLVAGDQSERFDLAYRCNFSDGTSVEGTLPASLLATVSTQFLVRATIVGGGTSRTLDIDPDTRTADGGMAIRSTGPYSLEITSDNDLTLLPAGMSNPATAPEDQKLPYDVRIGGDLMTPLSPPKLCARSGLSGAIVRVNTRLAATADPARVRAGTYRDVITVTVTPEVNGSGTINACGV
jgi:hypothetical protein